MMKKKNKISLESEFWAGYEIKSPFELIDAFFDFAHIDSYKEKLNEMMMFMYTKEVYKSEYPGQIFVIYKALHSFIRAAYRLKRMQHHWKVNESEVSLKSSLGMLSIAEFSDPFSVFQTAFTKQTLSQFDYFLSEITHLSLSPHVDEFGRDLMTPFIYVTKMLEAAQLMKERGVEKII